MLGLPEELLEKVVDLLEGDEETLSALAGVERTLYRIAKLGSTYSPREGMVERLIERIEEKDLVRFVDFPTRCERRLMVRLIDRYVSPRSMIWTPKRYRYTPSKHSPKFVDFG